MIIGPECAASDATGWNDDSLSVWIRSFPEAPFVPHPPIPPLLPPLPSALISCSGWNCDVQVLNFWKPQGGQHHSPNPEEPPLCLCCCYQTAIGVGGGAKGRVSLSLGLSTPLLHVFLFSLYRRTCLITSLRQRAAVRWHQDSRNNGEGGGGRNTTPVLQEDKGKAPGRLQSLSHVGKVMIRGPVSYAVLSCCADLASSTCDCHT